MNIVYTKSDCQLATVTIFAIPKPFEGHIGLIQYNAIASWTKLKPRPEIFLYGDEAGTKETCQKLGLIHVPEIKRNDYGTPLLDGIFAETCDRAANRIIVYLNADIILMNDFLLGVSSCDRQLKDYLLIGRRWDLDLDQQLDFALDWQSELTQLIKQAGCLADYDCKDYFVFPQHLFREIPAFAVGRGYWDTWMVNHALAENYPVVDCSLAITVAHQNHPYVHIRGGRNEAYIGREAQINKSLGNVTQPGNIACANWQLKPDKSRKLPQVSIVIVANQASVTIEKAVLSILIQDYDNYEIIVINNGCDWETEAILQEYKSELRYYATRNCNENNAYAYGLNLAKGEFVLYLDPKSILLPKILSQQVLYFEQEASTLDILFSGSRIIEEEKVMEYQPWDYFSNLENLKYKKLSLSFLHSFLGEITIMFRRQRMALLKPVKYNSLVDKILKLISIRECRAKCLKLIATAKYL